MTILWESYTTARYGACMRMWSGLLHAMLCFDVHTTHTQLESCAGERGSPAGGGYVVFLYGTVNVAPASVNVSV